MKKILCVCTANLQRSPTLEAMLNATPEYEARSAGTHPAPDRQAITEELLLWADRIIVFEDQHRRDIRTQFWMVYPQIESKIRVMHIPDDYNYGETRLVRAIRHRWMTLANVWLMTPGKKEEFTEGRPFCADERRNRDH